MKSIHIIGAFLFSINTNMNPGLGASSLYPNPDRDKFAENRAALIPQLRNFVDEFRTWSKAEQLEARITESTITLDRNHKEKVVFLALNMVHPKQTRLLISCVEYIKSH